MRLELTWNVNDTEDVPNSSLLSDKTSPVSDGFATFFTLVGLFFRNGFSVV